MSPTFLSRQRPRDAAYTLFEIMLVLGIIAVLVGSAIFLHCARPDYGPTEGCVAVARDDLLALLREAKPGDALTIRR